MIKMDEKSNDCRYLANGCFGKKMDDHPVNTIPNHHPTKMDVLPKIVFKSSLLLNIVSAVFKYSTSDNQQ